jgi:hypothetical protein
MARDCEQKQLYEQLKGRVEANPLLKRYVKMGMKEGLFSDVSGALGQMHNSLVEAAYAELIGRNIIDVKPTTEALERFPLERRCVAYAFQDGAITRLSGSKHSTVDITCDQLAESSEEWSKEFAEDATWNVMDSFVGGIGRILGENETTKVIALYAAIAAADLATAAVLAASNAVMSWALLLSLHHAVRSENWRPTVLAVNEMQLHQLLNDDKFVNSQYLPSVETDLSQGFVTSVLGMKVQASTLVPNGTAYAIDTRVAAKMLLRRDVMMEDWADPKTGKIGVRGTTRFGLGVLRSTAVSKMTGIKTTLT